MDLIRKIIAYISVSIFLLVKKIDSKKRSSQELEKYVAASVEDLSRLFDLEKELWTIVKNYQKKDSSMKDNEYIEKFFSQTQFEKFCSEPGLKHVSHPVKAFHALKRTTSLWEEMILRLEKQSKLKKAKQILRKFPERSDFEEGAAFGLMTIQLYYNISYDVRYNPLGIEIFLDTYRS